MNDWYYESDGERKGPFDEIKMKELVSSGTIKPDAMLWLGDKQFKASETDLFKRINLRKKFKIISIIFLTLTGLFLIGYSYLCNKMDNAVKEFICFKKIKSIGLALKNYNIEYDYFPLYDGAEGLEILRKNDYLSDYNSFLCPNSKQLHAEYRMPLKEENVGYVYSGGLKETLDAENIPVLWDKYGNHKNFGHVLYCDGHVERVNGKNWQEKLKTSEKNGAK